MLLFNYFPPISDPPFFTIRPDQYYQRRPSQSVTMPCDAIGDPTPHIEWRKVSLIYALRHFIYLNSIQEFDSKG